MTFPAITARLSRTYDRTLAGLRSGWPDIETINDITIAPFAKGSGKTKMFLPVEPQHPSLQHLHYEYNLKETVNRIEFVDCDPRASEATHVDKPVIYGGPLFAHFGHLIAESTHRTWIRKVYPEFARAKIAFIKVGHVPFEPYLLDTFALKGVAAEDLLIVDRPTAFRKLLVAPQARQMSGRTINRRYKYLFDGIVERAVGRSDRSGSLYLSRSRHAHTGSFYGEKYIEDVLRDAGFEIVFPEDHPVPELVRKLRSSRISVFAEGSAIHALELCGAQIPDAFVIGRRPFNTDRFAFLLEDLCGRWKISNRVLANFGLAKEKKKHSGFLDLEQLIVDLRDFTGLALPPVDKAAIQAAVDADVEAHIARFAQDAAPGAVDTLRALSRQPG